MEEKGEVKVALEAARWDRLKCIGCGVVDGFE